MNAKDLNVDLNALLCEGGELRSLFSGLGFDSHRDGHRTLRHFCQSHGLEPQTVAKMLAALSPVSGRTPIACAELLTLPELCDHLERTHRKHLLHQIWCLDQMSVEAIELDGCEASKCLRIRKAIRDFSRHFVRHVRHEADVVFPIIRTLGDGRGRSSSRAKLKSQLMRMEREHSKAEEGLAELREMIDGPETPTAPGLRTMVKALARFEQALHGQIYVENHILFQRALTLHSLS